ncbi:hypothetical protein B484DRAFT_244092 [Ochromonadaceae sp. CCMP2298]|nr:hypothetical protein B484DRAFT_244092 [Ochromonadaceae sp. CCMP2298]
MSAAEEDAVEMQSLLPKSGYSGVPPASVKELQDAWDEDEETEEERKEEQDYIDSQLCTMWGDLKLAVYDVRLSAPIIALLGMLLAYHITIAPYRHNIVGGGNTPMKDLNGIRPLLDSSTLLSIQQIMLRQENKLQLPVDLDTGSFGGLRTSGGTVSYRWVPTVNKFGTHELPDFFYEGVLFGISAQNSHDVMVGHYYIHI